MRRRLPAHPLRSLLYFFAALATFFFLVIREVIETSMWVTLFRARGFRAWHAGLLFWGFVCPLASLACVVKWVTEGDVKAQYLAVGLQFAYFLGAMPELWRERDRGSVGDGDRAVP